MASDSLFLDLHPSLREALSIAGDSGPIDYFLLLGIERDAAKEPQIDRAIMTRSKQLRPWQNSPQHGDEVVKLLPMLHRIAAILKDATRRKAYEKELDRVISGADIDYVEEFRQMVRAALADGVIDQKSKGELLRYARDNKIEMAEAGRIVNEIAADAAPAKVEATSEDFEVKLAGETGPEAFRSVLNALKVKGKLNKESGDKMLDQCASFSVSEQEATAILRQIRIDQFLNMVNYVAKDGVLNNNQARLLMPKAAAVGLNGERAFEILSKFTFTGASQEDLQAMTLTTPSFETQEIEDLLGKQKMVHHRSRWTALAGWMPDWLGSAALGALGLLVVGAVGFAAMTYFSGRGNNVVLGDLGSTPADTPPTATPARSGAPADANNSRATPAPTVASAESTPRPTASPSPAPDRPLRVWEKNVPDPPSGLIPLAGGAEAGIREVSNAEYQEFVNDTLGRPPENGFSQATAGQPVTGIDWNEAKQYAQWFASKKLGLGAEAGRLLKADEFAQLISAPISGGRHVSDDGFWRKARFGAVGIHDGGAFPNDALYFEAGRVYDLIGNAAEWGEDESGDGRAVFGGDFEQSASDFDPRDVRFFDPATRSATIGFRVVIDRN